MDQERPSTGFELSTEFIAGERSGGLELGPFASQYQELFADALEDGVITAEERQRLDRAAANLGIAPSQIQQLEQAMVNAYEMHHRVKVVEKWERAVQSLSPLEVGVEGDPGRALLVKQIERLQRRVVELEAELRDARAHLHVEVDVSDLQAPPTIDEQPEQLSARIRRDPTNAELFHRLYHYYREAGDLDGQYRAASALVVLGDATDSQRELHERRRRQALIAPRRALQAGDWSNELCHPDQEITTANIFSLLAPAALMGRVAALRREKKLMTADVELLDPSRSTVMAVRALGWAAAVLGMPAPSVLTDASREVGYAVVPNVPPFTMAGSKVLKGCTQLDHAFLAGRHLTSYRAEYFVKELFPALPELEDLFLAALLIGRPGLPIASHLRDRVAPISEALEPMLPRDGVDALRQQFQAFVEDGGRTNLLRFSVSADKTACRAGLLLCDDLSTACRLLEPEEGKRGPLAQDLLGFVVSERYARLRKKLGIDFQT